MSNSGKILPFDFHLTARKMQTTLPMILPEVQEACTRRYQMLALLMSRGLVKFNDFGLGINWKIKFRNHKLQGSNGENPRQYSQINQYQTAYLDWRGYEVTDVISKNEIRRNKGEAALIRVFDEFESNLRKSIENEMGPQFYNDGYDESHPDYWHGLMSLFRQNGQTLGPSNTPRARNDADKVIVPAGHYGQLSVELGHYGGAQHDPTVNWPDGTADTQLDFWSPLMLQWDAAGFTGTSNGEKFKNALRFGLTHAQRNSDSKGAITQAWTDRTNMIDLKEHYEGKQTIEVTAGTELYKLGFKDVIVFDGVEISTENAMPKGFGIGVNIENVEIRCLDAQLFEMDGPEYDMDLKVFKAAVESNSNMLFRSPRNMMFLAPKSAVVAA
jgi:hypothetical protein